MLKEQDIFFLCAAVLCVHAPLRLDVGPQPLQLRRPRPHPLFAQRSDTIFHDPPAAAGEQPPEPLSPVGAADRRHPRSVST
jgi:hypothetical protein